MARYTREELMHRAQIAAGELGLSSWTQADRKRLSYLEQALVALDEEQSLVKVGIEELLESYQDPVGGTAETALAALVTGLQNLLGKDKPRVNYPDRELVLQDQAAAWDRGYEAALNDVESKVFLDKDKSTKNPYKKP